MKHSWLDKYFPKFLKILGKEDYKNYVVYFIAHEKFCYECREYWEEHGVPFNHASAIFLLGFLKPWYDEIRGIEGCVKQGYSMAQWVVEKYESSETNFKCILNNLDTVYIGYFHGPNKEIEKKVGYKHGDYVKKSVKSIVNRVLKADLNVMVIQGKDGAIDIVWIDNGCFKQR